MSSKINLDPVSKISIPVLAEIYLWHLNVAKLVPEILDGVESNHSCDEKSNPFHTVHKSNANSCQDEPCEPLSAEALVLEPMEFGPAQDSCEGKAQKHRVEEDESADSGVGVLAEHHKRNEPNGRAFEVHLAGSEVCQWDTDSSKEGVESAHEGVVELIGVFLSGFEFEGPIVACHVSGQSNQHLSKRRVHIEVEFTFEVVGTEFTKTISAGQSGVL